MKLTHRITTHIAKVGVPLFSALTLLALIGAIVSFGQEPRSIHAAPNPSTIGDVTLLAACSPADQYGFSSESVSGWMSTQPTANSSRSIQFRSSGGYIRCENGQQAFYGTANSYRTQECSMGKHCLTSDWTNYDERTGNMCGTTSAGYGRGAYVGCDPFSRSYKMWGSIG
ncbi:hypothetical protein [Nocardia sp. SSK8]|uniref:hypothetical protein n=1 Tax=Nocardia sp. SSK8 TaxID=3120154 RepID=UPI0030089C1F